MKLKNFLISIIKKLIVFVVLTFVFSSIFFDVPDLLKVVFEDVFTYASPEVQEKVIGKLTETCSTDSFLNLSKVSDLCKDYKAGKINDKGFFFGFIDGVIPNQISNKGSGSLGKYMQAMEYLNNNRFIYFIILIILLIILYLLIPDSKLFVTTLIGLSLQIGIAIMLPYLAIIAYDKLAVIDTTPLMESMFGAGAVKLYDPKVIISLIWLLLFRTYTPFIITVGSLFLGVGIIGKIGKIIKKKFNKKSSIKKD